MKRWLLFAVLIAACFQTADNTPPRVSFVRPPRIVSDRDVWTLYIRVPRHAENRKLVVAAVDNGDVISQTERDLDGDRSPAMWNVTWRLSEMDGSIVAALFGVNGKQLGRDSFPLCVRGPLGECPSLLQPSQ